MGKLADTDLTTVEEAVGVNYLGPVNVARASFKYLAESRGHLLLYTSSSYTRGRADYSLYSSTKAAVVNLTQALADEWASHGIRVNCASTPNAPPRRCGSARSATNHPPPSFLRTPWRRPASMCWCPL